MKPHRQFFFAAALLTLGSIALSQSPGPNGSPGEAVSPFQDQSAPVSRKIDPALTLARAFRQQFPLRRLAGVETYAPGEKLPQAVGDAAGVLIKGKSDVRQLVRNVGGVVGSQHGDVYTAIIPLNTLSQLASDDLVVYVEGSKILYNDLDLSVPKTGADILHAQIDPSLQLTGKGVIVGFTDSGIDYFHPSFKTATGKTRILKVWDQYAAGTPPSGFTYGAEFDSSQINAGTASFTIGDHGTHVTGIAAGNGLPSKAYVGMAPEADIIMVVNSGQDLFNRGQTTVGTLDGYDYVRTKATQLGKRFVINTSQGTNLGPHDGKSLFEQAVNADVAAGAINVLSAGNEATSARHASAVVGTGSPREIDFSLSGGTSYVIPLDIWYTAADRMQIEVKKMSDASYRSPVATGSSQSFVFDSVTVAISSITNSVLNGDNEIYLTVTLNMNIPSSGPYRMRLRFSAEGGNLLPSGGRVDLWWERNWSVRFLTNVDQSMTIGMPAAADSAITVASYDNRGVTADAISYFSGRGPRRDGVLKPEITGVGGNVTSAWPGSTYATISGTSMSSPHVAGAVALLLQKYPTWSSYQIRQRLFSSATSDAYTGSVPNPTWGYGKLNILNAVGLSGTFPKPPTLASATLSGANVILSWTDPTQNIDGSNLTDLWRIFIFRDGALIDSANAGVQTYTNASVPPGVHSYYLTAKTTATRFSAKSASRTVTYFVKSGNILLVDDDAGANYQTFYTTSLSNLGFSYDVWNVSQAGEVSAATLLQYNSANGIVIWLTGDDFSTTLTSTEQAALQSYLDAGGKLFVSGQDIGYNLDGFGSSSDKSFYHTYLKATYAQDNVALNGVRGLVGGTYDALQFKISGGTGANNQRYPDEVDPISPAVATMVYDPSISSSISSPNYTSSKKQDPIGNMIVSSGSAAIQYENGSSRLVYFSFGFEAIDQQSYRDSVMARTLRFLNAPPPPPPSISVVPDSLGKTLSEGDTATVALTIHNSGSGLLNWRVAAIENPTGNSTSFAGRGIEFGARSSWMPWDQKMFEGLRKPLSPNAYGSRSRSDSTSFPPKGQNWTAAVTASTPLFGVQSGGIAQINPLTGSVVKTFSLSVGGGPDGLAFDGSYFYYINGFGANRVVRLDAGLTRIVDTLSTVFPASIDGLAVDGRLLYALDYGNGRIHAVDLQSKAIVATLDLSSRGIGGGISYGGQRGTLFVSNFGTAVFEINSSTGQVLNSFIPPFMVYGVAFSSSANVLFLSSASGGVAAVDPSTGSVLYSVPGTYSGLASDEAGGSFFAIDPRSGTIQAGSSQVVDVLFDARSVDGGTSGTTLHSGIKIAHNDPTKDTVRVPVTLGVNPDNTLPGAITDLQVVQTMATTATLTWTAPGDNGNQGAASKYDLRYSPSPITSGNFASATRDTNVVLPGMPGAKQQFTIKGLSNNTTYYFAMKTLDEVPLTSVVSNVASGMTHDVFKVSVVSIQPAYSNNNDGVLNPGEFFQLQFRIVNGTSASKTISSFEIDTTADPYLYPYYYNRRFNGRYGFGTVTISPGDSAGTFGTPPLVVSSRAANGYVLRVPFKFYDNNNQLIGVDTVKLTVSGSDQASPVMYSGTGDTDIQPHFTPVGQTATVRAYVYDGGPIASIADTMWRLDNNSVAGVVTLYDDGTHGDITAGDHLFTGSFTPAVAADYGMTVGATDSLGNFGYFNSKYSKVMTSIPFVVTNNQQLVLDAAEYNWWQPGTDRYTQTLVRLGKSHDVWQSYFYGTPDTSILNRYGNVLYYRFDNSGPSSADQSNLMRYLDRGGRLMIAGQGIVQGANGSTFANSYLHASWRSDGYSSVVGKAGDPISGNLNLTIDGSGDGFMWDWWGANDEVDPILSDGAAQVDTVYKSSAGALGAAALRVMKAPYRLVYTGFPFHAISTAQNRDSVMARALRWLSVPYVPGSIAVVPDSFRVVLSEGDSTHQTLEIRNTGSGALTYSISSRELGVQSGVTQASIRSFLLPRSQYALKEPENDKVAGKTVELPQVSSALVDLTAKSIGYIGGSFGFDSDLLARGATLTGITLPLNASVLTGFQVIAVDDAIYSLSANDIQLLRSWVQSGNGLLMNGDNSSSMPNINSLLDGSGIAQYYFGGSTGIISNFLPHDITRGVTQIYEGAYQGASNVSGSARAIAFDPAGRIFTAVSYLGGGRIVAIGNEIRAADFSIGETRQFSNQIIDWLACGGGAPYLVLNPTSGIIAAGQSHSVDIKFDASQVEGGTSGNTYKSLILVSHNDPAKDTVRVPVTLDVNADNVAPGAIADLQLVQTMATTATLTSTAPGDNGNQGVASKYDLRYSTSPITSGNFASATRDTNVVLPGMPGTKQQYTIKGLSNNTTYYFAIKTIDEVPLASPISNIASGVTHDVFKVSVVSVQPAYSNNNDGVLNPGEFFQLQFRIVNGTTTSKSIDHVSIDTTADPYLYPFYYNRRFGNTYYYGVSISPGDSAGTFNTPVLVVSSRAPNGYVLKVPFKFYDNNNQLIGVDTVKLTVSGSDQASPVMYSGTGDTDIQPHFTPVGQTATVRAYVYDGGPITSIADTMWRLDNNSVAVVVTLYDDGTHGDVTAGDHLFTGSFTPSVAADYGMTVGATDSLGNFGYFNSKYSKVMTSIPFVVTNNQQLVLDAVEYNWWQPGTDRYTQTLGRLGKSHDVWQSYFYGSPDTSILNRYANVLYYRFDNGGPSSADQSNLMRYLDRGGRLMIAGQGIVQGANGSTFANSYLHASWRSDGYSSVVGKAGDPISGNLNLTIDGSGDGFMWDWWGANDEVNPILSDGAAQVDTVYKSSAGALGAAALRVMKAPYRLVYTGFPFHAISTAQNRDSVMARTLRWLSVPFLPGSIAVTPSSFSGTLSEGDTLTQMLKIKNSGSGNLVFSISDREATSSGQANSLVIARVTDALRSRAVVPDSGKSSTGQSIDRSKFKISDVVTTAFNNSVTTAGGSVAVLGAQEPVWLADVRDKVASTGQFASVTAIDVRSVTPTLQELKAFRSVLVFRNYSFADPVALGNVLADYVDQGGGVVVSIFALYPGSIGGRFTSGDYYAMTASVMGGPSTSLGTVYLPAHPVMKNVTSFNGGSASFRPYSPTLMNGATRIADWSDGSPLVVERIIRGHNRVDLGMFPISSSAFSSGWQASTDGANLMANALLYVGGTQWLAYTPSFGVVSPNDSATVAVRMDARVADGGATGSTYSSTLLVSHNDPAKDTVRVPVTLAVNADNTPPGAITDLQVVQTMATTATLTWTAPGDNGSQGVASKYDLRYSTSPITSGNFASATRDTNVVLPGIPGAKQQYTIKGLSNNTTYYFAIKTIDEVPLTSAISNIASGVTHEVIKVSVVQVYYSYSNNGDNVLNPGEFFNIQYRIVNGTATSKTFNYVTIDTTADSYLYPFYYHRRFNGNYYAGGTVNPGDSSSLLYSPVLVVSSRAPNGYMLRVPFKLYDNNNQLIAVDTVRLTVTGSDQARPVMYWGTSETDIQPHFTPVGQPAKVQVWVYEGGPITTIQDTIWRLDNNSMAGVVTLYDDGMHGDVTAGDHQFTGSFTPSVVADYGMTVGATDSLGNFGYFNYRYTKLMTSIPFMRTVSSNLVVDASGGSQVQTSLDRYTQTLGRLGKSYDIWRSYFYGSPDTSVLNRYSVVVYYSINSYEGPNPTDQTNLMRYLDRGGRLFIAGQGVVEYANGTSFANNYLHASIRNGYASYDNVVGKAGDPISDNLNLALTGGDSYYPYSGYGTNDEVNPLTSDFAAQVDTVYKINASGLGATAMKVVKAPYRLVYFGFPFEAISTAQNRDSVMARALRWLSIPVGPSAPKNLTAIAGNGQVALRWARNAESDVVKYRIYMGTSINPTVAIDSTSSVADTSITIGGLTNGTTYYFRVIAVGNTSLESVFSNQVSAAPFAGPSAPTNLAALEGNQQVRLTWNRSTATNVLKYYVYRGTAPNPTTLVDSTGNWMDTTKTLSGLTNDQTYYFRVAGVDSGYVIGPYSNQVASTPSLNAGRQWQFVRVFPDSSFRPPNGVNNGVAVDPAGKVWIQTYSGSYDSLAPGVKTGSIYAYNPTGTQASFSPIKVLSGLTQVGVAVTDTLNGSGYGLGVDPSTGNILSVKKGNRLWKIDYRTGAGIRRIDNPIPGYTSSLSAPAADQYGEVFIAPIIPPAAVTILNSDFTLAGNVTNATSGFIRCIAVSADGNDVYVAGFNVSTIWKYHSANGSLGPHVLQDSILGLVVESMTFHPKTGYLWMGSGNITSGLPAAPYQPYRWYAYNLSTKSIVDSIVWNGPVDSDPRPRGIAFSPTGDTAYVAAFAVSVPPVQVFIRGGSVSQSPAAPTLASPADGATGQSTTLTLTWNASTGATSYRLQVSTASSFATTVVNDSTLTGTSRQAGPLMSATTYYWRVNAKNSDGTSAWSSTWSFTTALFPPPASWNFAAVTGNNGTIAVPSAINPSTGTRALQTGDGVGVFFTRNDSLICAGYSLWQDGQNMAISAWGDNDQTTMKDGFASGESIRYKIWDAQAGKELGALVQYQTGGTTYTANGIYVLSSLVGYTNIAHGIRLPQGWNMISSFVVPKDSTLDTVFVKIKPRMVIAKNGAGKVYWPALSINTIGKWRSKDGYQLYMQSTDTVTINGDEVNPQQVPIIMSSGWSLVSYLRNSPMKSDSAVATLGTSLVIAKNGAGQVYWPALSINTIGNMKPGQGYQMYLSSGSTLTYPANALSSPPSVLTKTVTVAESQQEMIPEHYRVEKTETGSNATFVVKGIELKDGDEVGVKGANGKLIGSGVVKSNRAVFAVWGDNILTEEEKEGAVEGESLVLTVWSESGNKERSVSITSLTDGLSGQKVSKNLTYATDGAWEVEIGEVKQIPTVFSLEQNYPNPFNPSTVIRYGIPKDVRVSLEVYNMLGQKIMTLVDSEQKAGYYEVMFQANNLSSGVYFYTMSAGEYRLSKKLTLLK